MELRGQDEEMGKASSFSYNNKLNRDPGNLDYQTRVDNPGQDPDPVSAPVPQPDGPLIRYRECLKNHAASMGGHVVDGCGEFMPSGEDGTGEALKCAACECHRNFHRKEINGEPQCTTTTTCCAFPYYKNNTGRDNSTVHHPHQQQQPPPIAAAVTTGSSKKRFRTKLSKDQKEKMVGFAEKLGWRIQKQDEAEVQQFCGEVGVKRQVFKVWMHNSKQAMKRKQM
ncbi:hypothetical protein HRI_003469100 [Hibiscus trionum]|uniref:ZF-HD dimerization-type domain-containing protein n=1 Tax=Hibiscus trionum TaxID=183268 RepID=A0A9W7MDV8_HIBTR|nr:hypothetical protein HRI_003469100 [Hibiscus trionum]